MKATGEWLVDLMERADEANIKMKLEVEYSGIKVTLTSIFDPNKDDGLAGTARSVTFHIDKWRLDKEAVWDAHMDFIKNSRPDLVTSA